MAISDWSMDAVLQRAKVSLLSYVTIDARLFCGSVANHG